MKRLKEIPAWTWIGALAFLMRIINLGSESIWYDEAFTAWLARLPFADMMQAIKGDVHPPLWYIIEWGVVRTIGSSAFALRLPNVFFGVLAVLLIYRLCQALNLSRQITLTATLFAAIMPANLYYSQDARMYPLLCCAVLGMVIAAIESSWYLFALCAVGALYTQNLGLFYVFGLGMMAFLLFREQRKTIVFIGLLIILSWTPWFLFGFIPQAAQVKSGFWLNPLTLPQAVLPLFTMTVGWRIADVFQIHIFGLILVLTFVGLYSSRKWIASRPGVILITAIFGSTLLMILVSVFWRSIYLQRALLPATMMLPIFWAYALFNLSPTNRQIARLALIPVLLIAIVSHYFPAEGGRDDVRNWASVVNEGWQPGDVIYYVSIDSSISLGYYLPDKAYEVYPFGSDLSQSLTAQTKQAMGMKEMSFDDLRGAGFKRVWVVSANSPMISTQQLGEIARLTALPHTVMKSLSNDLLNESIMLIDL